MDIEAEFEKWADENGFSTEVFSGDYFDKSTQEAWKGWQGAITMMHEKVLRDYGICPQCLTHYVEVEANKPEFGRAMECDCSVDLYRETKIIKILNEVIKRG